MNINPEQLYTYKSLFSVRRVQTTSHVDMDVMNILGIYGSYKVIVSGE